MTRDDVLLYLDSCRKSENEDPLHKWIGSYNTKQMTLVRFFKWSCYSDVDSSKRRSGLSASERKPECIMGIPKIKRKEISCYKPSDLWTQEDDLLFLKWVTNKRDRCYHTMSRDLSARPHEILNLKIKDIMFKIVDSGKQYAEVLVNGKIGSRHIPLIQSIPYIKDWLSNHPSRNNPKSPLFVGLDNHSMGRRQLTLNGLYRLYRDYKQEFFQVIRRSYSTKSRQGENKKSSCKAIQPLHQKAFSTYREINETKITYVKPACRLESYKQCIPKIYSLLWKRVKRIIARSIWHSHKEQRPDRYLESQGMPHLQ